ncbi:hypothetical protein RJT34_32416 [Clitoria ternatea]|uniref:Uncharacterized protein n=1 Tax=Clitoria ternatea TaxID=43366 RepID=A0AAN9I5W6_CLITE
MIQYLEDDSACSCGFCICNRCLLRGSSIFPTYLVTWFDIMSYVPCFGKSTLNVGCLQPKTLLIFQTQILLLANDSMSQGQRLCFQLWFLHMQLYAVCFKFKRALHLKEAVTSKRIDWDIPFFIPKKKKPNQCFPLNAHHH